MLISKILVAVLTAGALAAQTPLSGNVQDGAGGPLRSGVVYHLTGSITVPAGATLTIEPGAIVKSSNQIVTVAGTLLARGTAASPVIFTSLTDDSAGGDTNGDGPSSGAPNQWYGIFFQSTAGGSVLTHTSVRFTGVGGWAAAMLGSASPRFDDCEFRDVGRGGIRCDATSRPLVNRCRFVRVAGEPAIHSAHLEAVPGFVDNVATASPGFGFVRVNHSIVGAATTIGRRNGIGGVVVVATSATVSAGASLELGAGVVVKTVGSQTWIFAGTLRALGTASEPVVFTEFRDDSAGGDTNGDGPSNGTVNSWYGLLFNAGSEASRLEHASVRFGGVGGWAGIWVTGADLVLRDSEIRDCGAGGLRLVAGARPTVERCVFRRIGNQPAIAGVNLPALPGFADNDIADCPGGAYLRLDSWTPTADVTVPRRSAPGGVLALAMSPTVPTGVTVTFEAGIAIKVVSSQTVTIDGTLRCLGTAQQPVVWTSFTDDAYGGDTNGDGPSAVTVSQWYGLFLRDGADASRLEHTVVRGSGVGGWAAIDCVDADATILDCSIESAGTGGVRCNAGARPVVERCRFDGVRGRPAVDGLALAAVAGFLDNEAANCPGGAFVRVTGNTLAETAVVSRRNQINGAIVLSSSVRIGATGRLVMNPGVVVKFQGAQLFDVFGRLEVYGLVVFTIFTDDAHGGDTNQDGNASSPSRNSWYGISIHAGAIGILDRALLRWCGTGGWEGVDCDSNTFAISRSRVEFSSIGFAIRSAAVCDGLVAYANQNDGIRLLDAPVTLRRATVAYNGGRGIVATNAAPHRVRSCIAFGNGGVGFAGFGSGLVQYSDGSGITGGVGNLDVDPRFVDAAIGDLRLVDTSPCIDAGDPADVTLDTDALNFPRYLDGDLDGAQRIDMGAHEFCHAILFVTGDARPGTVLTASYAATSSIGLGALTLGLPATSPLPLFNLGPLYVDLTGPFDAFVVGTFGSTQIPVPLGVPTPLGLQFQFVGVASPFPRGNLSNPAYVEIR